MKIKIVFVFFLVCNILNHETLQAQTSDSFIMKRHADNVFFVTMEGMDKSQATVIEYRKYLVVVEFPFIDLQAEKTTTLRQHTIAAESFLQFVTEQFPKKPIKYLLSSHWHSHSVSAITPFFERGTKLVTTGFNWQYSIDHGFLGASEPEKLASNVVLIKQDTELLKETNFPINVLYLDSTYANKPTKDYLFFYFPAITTLHASCMCTLSNLDLTAKGSFIYSDRMTDLNRAISSRKLEVADVIRMGRIEKGSDQDLPPVFTRTYMEGYMAKGMPTSSIVKKYTSLTLSTLRGSQDSLLRTAVLGNISPQIINQAVYSAFTMKKFQEALELAKILNLLKPGQVNYIDTLGEAYFASGDVETASYYQRLLLTLDSKFDGGIKVWEKSHPPDSKH